MRNGDARTGFSATVVGLLLVAPGVHGQDANPPPVQVSNTFHVGERFHLEGVSQNTKRRHVTAPGDQQPDLNERTTVSYGYDVEILAVDNGWPVRQRCRITKLDLDLNGQRRSLLDGALTVLVSLADNGFTEIKTEHGSAGGETMRGLYHVIHLEKHRVTPEALVASDVPYVPKQKWAITPALAMDYLGERDLDAAPGSVRAAASFVGLADVGGTTCEAFSVHLSSEQLQLAGVLPDGMTLTKASVDVTISLFAPKEKRSPILRETTDMVVSYTGRGHPGGVAINAEHVATIRTSWTRTPLAK